MIQWVAEIQQQVLKMESRHFEVTNKILVQGYDATDADNINEILSVS